MHTRTKLEPINLGLDVLQIDLVSRKDASSLAALVKMLNPDARIIQTKECQVQS